MVRYALRTRVGWRGTSFLVRAALGVSVCVVAGCGGGASNGGAGPPASTPALTVVRVSLETDAIPVGQTTRVRAAGLGGKGEAVGIGTPVWSTASSAVATVSANGVVRAVAPGETMVIASVGGVQGQAPLTVVQLPIARVSISPVAVRMVQGATLQLTATALDFNGHALPDRTVSWTSADVSKATVTASGMLTAVSPGVTTIVATGEGVSASAVVTITDVADAVAKVSLSPTVGSVTVGGTVQLVAALTDIAGRALGGRTVTWSASVIAGANVATVSSTGLVTAVSPGTVIIEAFSEGQHGAATISVTDDLDASIVVTFAAPSVNEVVGDTLRMIVGVRSAQKPASVEATLGSLRTTLKFGYAGPRGVVPLWVGLLDITDIPAGPHTLMVTATAPGGERGVGSIRIQRDFRKGKGGSGQPPRNK
ncbi:MAG: Ig-like domain-containing protein [Gemmatimonadaceae bacterium]|nr:Ig-like domain-containing protein [Gemmatimonadaceae bacterium]